MSDPAVPLHNLTALEEAEERAFRRGQESALQKAKVEQHEVRLNAINGHIARGAQAQERTATAVLALTAKVDQTAAIAVARAQDAERAAKETLSTRTFVFALTGTAVGVCTVVIAALALFLQ